MAAFQPVQWRPPFAITLTGKHVDFGTLLYALTDLRFFSYITDWQYEESRYWITSYMNGQAMPGRQTFYCPWCKEEVLFLAFLDGLYELLVTASNEQDLTDASSTEISPEEAEELMIGEIVDDLYSPYPTNIGRYHKS